MRADQTREGKRKREKTKQEKESEKTDKGEMSAEAGREREWSE